MLEDESFWPSWARFLHEKGATELSVTLLEGAGPLRLIASQLMYASIPFFGSSAKTQQWRALAHLLEDTEKSASFISFLHGEAKR